MNEASAEERSSRLIDPRTSVESALRYMVLNSRSKVSMGHLFREEQIHSSHNQQNRMHDLGNSLLFCTNPPTGRPLKAPSGMRNLWSGEISLERPRSKSANAAVDCTISETAKAIEAPNINRCIPLLPGTGDRSVKLPYARHRERS